MLFRSVTFFWGKAYLTGYLADVSATFTMFNESGDPVRATVSLTIKEVDSRKDAQNPTSGSPETRETHTMVDGDSLHSVAFRQYGRASFWRGLAHANGIDDATRVRSGTRLLLPTMEEVAQWS